MRTLAFVLAMGLASPALAGGHGGFGLGGGGNCSIRYGLGVGLAPTYGVRAFAAPVVPAYGVQSFAAPVTSCGTAFGAPVGGCGGGGFSTFGAGIGYGATPVVTAAPVVPVVAVRRPGLRQRIRAARRGFRTGF